MLLRSKSILADVTNKPTGTLKRARQEKHAHRIRIMTYHGSKGLEADVVFLVGDCEQLTSSNWRNQTYAMAKLVMNGEAKAYDFAQGKEVMRLAYVTITRAKIHCYSFLDAPKPGSQGFPKASDRTDKHQSFFLDQRQ